MDSDAASAMADNQVMLNQERSTLNDTPTSKGKTLTTGSMLPTSKMSVEQILNCETQATDIQIAFDTPVGAVLYETPIGPGVINSDTTTRVEWLSKLFKYWRGSHTFRFVFTKSILQQMKIMVVFVPGATEFSLPPTPAQAIYYTHHLIMNPANETEASLTVPYVSPTPFLPIEKETGRLYVLLYQPLVSSFDTSTTPSFIYIKMFVAAALEMHEFVPLPPLDSVSETGVIADEDLWTIAVTSATNTTLSGSTTTVGLITDDGSSVATTVRGASSTPGFSYEARTVTCWPIAANGPNTVINYDPARCRTLYGNPIGAMTTRQVYLASGTHNAQGVYTGPVTVVTVGVNSTGAFMTNFTSGITTDKAYSEKLVAISGAYADLFSSAVVTLESMVADMRDELRREMFRSELTVEFGRAHGDEHSETCECDECKLWNKVFFTKWSFPSPGQIVESLPCCSRCDSQSDCWECDEEENQCLLDSRLYRYECGDCGATMTGSLDEQPDQFCSTCILEQANPSEIVEPVEEYYTSCDRCDQVVVQQLDADFQNLCADCRYVEVSGLDMSLETSRLLTFASWKNANASPIDLAKTGFYYLGVSDCVRCEACQVTVSDWQPEDVPEECHLKFSPNCSYFSAPEKGWQYVMEHGVVHEKFPETTPEFYKQDFRLVTSSDDRLCRCCLSNVFPNLYEITHF